MKIQLLIPAVLAAGLGGTSVSAHADPATDKHVYKVLAILFEYDDAPVYRDPDDHDPTHEINQANIARILFSTKPDDVSVNNIYRAATHDRIQFTGDVTPVLHIHKNHPVNPDKPGECPDANDVVDSKGVHHAGFRADAAEAALHDAHRKTSDYDVVINVNPGADQDHKGGHSCGGAGDRGTFHGGGQPYIDIGRDVGVATPARTGTYAHELGHTLGINHADVMHCGAQDDYLDGPGCKVAGQSDPTDVMGAGGEFHRDRPGVYGLSALYRMQLGLYEKAQIHAVSASGTYELGDFDLWTDRRAVPRIITFAKADTTSSYSLQYTKGLGVLVISTTSDHHTMTHNSRRPLLREGQVVADPVNGITIRLVKIETSSVTVEVKLDDKRAACAAIASTKPPICQP